ncbi:hypothetical protein TWF788_008738 [Orbilia oligospora]|nr:hypothetical protein TWF788_008738 [Orbilia oligospora]KAF3201627.1 hypothetical protein TWF679_011246 [Orbilia oligospora]KAF3245533.1 hypothetical protein TWF192_007398 [Orbilia oligospora]
MSSVPPRDPLASTNPNSSALNQSHLVFRVPEPLGDGGSSDSLRHSKLPPQNAFPTYRPGESSRQLAQAALQYGSEYSTEGFGEGEITQDYNSGSLAFDPSLSSSFSMGNESIEGQAQTHDDELDAEGSVQDEERLDFRPPALPPGKRRGSSLSPTSQQDAKKPCSESSRAREIASQLEAPLPPANTILAANQHAAAAAGPSSQGPGVYHGISLSPGGFQPQSQQQLLQANL